MSPAWGHVLGYDCNRLIGRWFAELVHDDDKRAMTRCLSDVAQNRTADAFETKAIHSDGSYRWVSWNATPIAKEQSVYIVGRDITELKRSQQLFEGVLQSAPDAMVIINPEGRIVMVNRVYCTSIWIRAGRDARSACRDTHSRTIPRAASGERRSMILRRIKCSTYGAGVPLRGLRKDGSEFAAHIASAQLTPKTAD